MGAFKGWTPAGKSIELRGPLEVQRAHDVIAMTDEHLESEGAPKDIVANLHTLMQVLCWVLRHEDGAAFESILTSSEGYLIIHDIELEDAGELHVRDKKPRPS